MTRAITAVLVLWALLLAGVMGYAIGLAARQPTPPTVDDVRVLRFDLDVLQGRTAAGLEMCRDAPETLLTALGAGEN